MNRYEHVTELIPGYALDCLDESEMELVSAHLGTCDICRAELRAYQVIADQLPLGAPVVEPPPYVKEKLMERVRSSSQPRHVQASGSSWREGFSRLLRRSAPVWSLVSLALIVILGASNLFLWRQVNQLNTANQAAMRVIQLQSAEAAPGATGLIVISMDGEHGTLVVDRLPVLSEEWQYQLWLIRDGQRISGGVFSVDDDGYGSLWVKATDPLASYPAFGITIEPAGGSPGPTGEKVLGGEL
jgi:anti-sigma-K factor RskA